MGSKRLSIKNSIKACYNKLIPDEYSTWIRNNEWDKTFDNVYDYTPLISILTPITDSSDRFINEFINSICNQVYSNWELILWYRTNTTSIKVLDSNQNRQITIFKGNNIQDVMDSLKGEFVSFLNCNDTVARNALYEFVNTLNKNKNLDFIYSDEDMISLDGKKRYSPFFKPDWSPDTFMSFMYTRNIAIYRKQILDSINIPNDEINEAAIYDLTLRFMELSSNHRVAHIPMVLYHKRHLPDTDNTSMTEATKAIKESCLKRRGLDGYTEYENDMKQYRVVYTNTSNPLISIIIPSKDNVDLLKQCIDSLTQKTNYKNYEIIIVDNGSNDDNKSLIQSYLSSKNAIYYYEPMAFNFSHMCNTGANLSHGDYLLFLNDDIEIFDGKWLDRMLGQASLEHVGAVGAKLYYPNSSIIQHSGVTNLVIGPAHLLIGYSDEKPYYFGRNKLDYDYLCVTAACLLISKKKYEEVNGFEEELRIAYNDVDFCFKLYEKGYYNVLRNDAVLFHHESASRGLDDIDPQKQKRLSLERDLLYSKHPNLKGKDPFYSTNLTTNRPDYSCNTSGLVNGTNRLLGQFTPGLLHNAHMKYCVDSVELREDNIVIRGWFYYMGGLISNNSEYRLLLQTDEHINMYNVTKHFRPDVSEVIGHSAINVGFECVIPQDQLNLDINRYRIGFMVLMPGIHTKRICFSDRIIDKSSINQIRL